MSDMAIELPYLPTYKNVPLLFEKIGKAKIPDAFTNSFLSGTLGLKSTNDRALISLLKKLGFLDNSGKPTSNYALLKNRSLAKRAIAEGIRRGYAGLYEADENAHQLTPDQLKGLVAQVSGTEEGMTKQIALTFGALTKLADFSKASDEERSRVTENGSKGEEKPDAPPGTPSSPIHHGTTFHPEFRFNVEVHLPSNGTEETYLNIFNALRKALS